MYNGSKSDTIDWMVINKLLNIILNIILTERENCGWYQLKFNLDSEISEKSP